MPVFSNMGEIADPAPLACRRLGMVMFASHIHGGFDQRVWSFCQKWDFGPIELFGAGAMENVQGVQCRHHSYLSPEAASALLCECRIAYTRYPVEYLAKSGIVAACAAHGLAVTVPDLPFSEVDGLRKNEHILVLDDLQSDPVQRDYQLQSAADRLRRWYENHTISATAQSYAAQIQEVAAASSGRN